MDLSGLLETWRSPLVGLLVSWGVPWSEAVELAQDSFSEAWLRRARCRGNWQEPAVFGAWLRGVARNVHRNWRRGNQRRRVRVALEEDVVRQAAAEEPEVDARLARMRLAIDKLPPKLRTVILMHYLDETRVAEVAVLLGVPPKTVEGRLYTARQRLRDLLGVPVQRATGRLTTWL